jgi:hypothetical protein
MVVLSHLCINAIFLPRQARDKHRDNSKKLAFSQVGAGTVATVLLDDADALKDFGVLKHLLSRVSADVLPFDVLSGSSTGGDDDDDDDDDDDGDGAGGVDLLSSKLEMMLARASDGWQVTLINNLGVSKQPRKPAVVDASHRVTCVLRLKAGHGVVGRAFLATAGSQELHVVHRGSSGSEDTSDGGSVELTVEAGGVAVVDIMLVQGP